MIKRFLRLFPAYRELKKQTESDANLIRSLERYIEALEGRDAERLNTIDDLETQCREAMGTIRELRKHLSGIMPEHREDA